MRFSQEDCVGVNAEVDMQVSELPQKLRMVVDHIEVVENDRQLAGRGAGASPTDNLAHLQHAATRARDSGDVVAMDVIEDEEVLDAVRAVVGGAHALRAFDLGPGGDSHRTHSHRAPFVETQIRHCALEARGVAAE